MRTKKKDEFLQRNKKIDVGKKIKNFPQANAHLMNQNLLHI